MQFNEHKVTLDTAKNRSKIKGTSV